MLKSRSQAVGYVSISILFLHSGVVFNFVWVKVGGFTHYLSTVFSHLFNTSKFVINSSGVGFLHTIHSSN